MDRHSRGLNSLDERSVRDSDAGAETLRMEEIRRSLDEMESRASRRNSLDGRACYQNVDRRENRDEVDEGLDESARRGSVRVAGAGDDAALFRNRALRGVLSVDPTHGNGPDVAAGCCENRSGRKNLEATDADAGAESLSVCLHSTDDW
jgi:hypothetical protein